MSSPLSEEEREIIDSMGEEVTFKPRPRLIGVDHLQHLEKWESIGFYSELEYNGWLQMNRLQNEMYEGYCVDVLHQKSGGDVGNE